MRLLLAAASALVVAGCGPRDPAQIRFESVPAESGLRFRHELPGSALDSLPKSAMGGFALIDYDGDGKVDVYCINGGWDETYGLAPKPAKPARSRLFRNLGGMKFEDVTDATGAGLENFALGACVGDIDSDGKPDLFVSCYGRSVLLRNRGGAAGFEDVTERAGIDVRLGAGAAFLDYDGDGDLDLFAGQYVDPAKPATGGMAHAAMDGTFPGPAAYEAMPSILYRNRGDGTFEDVTHAAQVGKGGKAMGVVAADFDGDGREDIYVANDSMPNFLWKNKGDGTFVDTAPATGAALGREGEDRASMGVTLADLDGDGREEILCPDTRGGVCYQPRQKWFTDRAADWGLLAHSNQLIGWTDAALDADCDGITDLYVVHGEIRTRAPQPSFLVRGEVVGGKGHEPMFDRVEDATGRAPDVEGIGRSALAADLDDDGREDILFLALDGRFRVWRNVTEDGGRHVRIRLTGDAKNPLAIGAVVRGTVSTAVGKRTLVRRVASSSGYLCAPDLRMHFGLGESSSLADVVITWPGGATQQAGKLDAGEHVISRK